MKQCVRFAVVIGLLVAAAAVAQRRGDAAQYEKPPVPRDDAERQVLAVIQEARRTGDVYLEVPDTDGRMLRLLTEAKDAKNVVEVGTSTGYSGLWLCLALQKTGGKLTTFELDHGRAMEARKHFQQAGVAKIATVVEGDAHETVKRLKEPIDVVFIDADKGGYVDYLNKLLPLVRPGGLVLAHNIEMAPEYVRAVTSNPDLETLFYMAGNHLSISLKKR